MNDKKSFILYTSNKEIIEKLSDEDAGKLFKGIFNYVESGLEPNLEKLPDIVFTIIKQQLDENAIKWEEKKNKKSEAGKKGMEIRWKKNNNVITNDNTVINDITNDNTVINDITKITDNVNVNVNVNDNVNDINNINNMIIIYNWEDNLKCECITSKNKKCERRSTYNIDGKNYCNQHSKGLLFNEENNDKGKNNIVNYQDFISNNTNISAYLEDKILLREKIEEWFKYKDERKEIYKETSINTLVKRIINKTQEYGEKLVIEIIDLSISSNWQGILWDKLDELKEKKSERKNDPYAGIPCL